MALPFAFVLKPAPRRAAAAAFTTLSSNHRYSIVTRAREHISAPHLLRRPGRRPRRALDHGMKSGSEERFRYLGTECRLSQTVSKWITGRGFSDLAACKSLASPKSCLAQQLFCSHALHEATIAISTRRVLLLKR